MGLEIVGGRMLSPDFGSGVWTWGSIISVFLAALSTGYFVGGLLSQRCPNGLGLAVVIFAAAVSIVPVAIWHRTASGWFADLGLHERWGALLAATALFFVPSMLLGMVSPYAVRLVTQDVTTVGTRAGTLYAISTVGSCLGCLFTSFYLILWMGIQRILYLSGGILVLIALLQLVTWHVKKAKPQEVK